MALVDQNAMKPLLARTISGAGWIVCWRMATRFLGLMSTLTLVRLLAPADFGLIAVAVGFTQAVDALSDLGVQDAVIREKAPTRELYDTAFTINVIRAMLTAAIVAAAAQPIAVFFVEPRLFPVLLALGVATALGGLANVAVLDFRRDLAFDKEFRLLALPRLLQVVATIGLALWWKSYWALIAGIVMGRLFSLITGYAMRPYRPGLTLLAWRSMTGFSVWMWLIGMATMLRERSDGLILGHSLGITQTGVYAIGTEIATLPTTELVEPLCRACFSGFAEARHSELGALSAYLRIVAAAALLTIPMGVGIALLADPIVELALGPQWHAAAPVVEVLAIAGVLSVFGKVSATLFSVHAYLGSMLSIVVVSGVLRVLLLFLMLAQWGLLGGAIGVALSIAFEQALFIAMTCRKFELPLSALTGKLWRPALGALGMTGALYLGALTGGPIDGGTMAMIERILAASAIGAAVYAAVVGVAWVSAGRPDGPEGDVGRLAQGFVRLLGAGLRSLRPKIVAFRPQRSP